jgi:preprotein translocase subunit SecG
LDKGMTDFLLYAAVVFLFLVSVLVVLIILMQRPSANAGMGSALGGGAAESVFGGESANVLSKMTTTLTVILFVLSFGLYLGFVARENKGPKALAQTPAVVAPVKSELPKAPVATPAAPLTNPATTPASPVAPVSKPAAAAEPVKSEPVPVAPTASGTKQ